MCLTLDLMNTLLLGFRDTRHVFHRRKNVVGNIDTIVNLSPRSILWEEIGVGLILSHTLLPSEITERFFSVITISVLVGVTSLRLLHLITQQVNPGTRCGGVTQITGCLYRKIAVSYQQLIKVFPSTHIVGVL